MEIHGVVSLNITIIFTSGGGGLSGKNFDHLKHFVCRNTDIRPSEIENDAPVVVSQQALEKTLARLGISAGRVRSASHSRGKLATLVDCQAAGSAEQHGSTKRDTIEASEWRKTANELQPAIDRIGSSIQRLNYQWQILDDAQKRLEKLFLLTSEEVDWDDPVRRIQSELDLFDCEETDP
ncbi:hypothetical protein ColTof4_01194 [Colletotrichum tofieldiae]|nr:hypothetical protein ColTof3_08424 [Colletotrichum tofieldiae]GKT68771.1 hypothetical protein ColTof4_01194 [Colletotrichum tofieldiae]GKT88611.1 hypothetical protein Ct61P_06461 [Colletotrichum tofieldiae]